MEFKYQRHKMELAELLVKGLADQCEAAHHVLNAAHAQIAEGEGNPPRSITFPIYDLQQQFKALKEGLERLQRDCRECIDADGKLN